MGIFFIYTFKREMKKIYRGLEYWKFEFLFIISTIISGIVLMVR